MLPLHKMTEKQARNLMAEAWKIHCTQYPDADPAYFTPDDVSITEIRVGGMYRDGDEITGEASYDDNPCPDCSGYEGNESNLSQHDSGCPRIGQ